MRTQDVDVIHLLVDLVRTPSINPVLDPRSSGEGGIAEAVVTWLHAHGVAAQIESVEPGRPNVVGTVGNPGGPSIALCAHLDTVDADGMTIPPFEPVLRDGRLYGRGAYDMKGGLAACMAAAARLVATDLRGCVKLALVCDEEHASIGAQHFVANHPVDACIVTEPSEGDLVLAHKGFLWARVTCHGTAAHGSRWDLGDSAVAKIARVVAELARFDEEELRTRRHPLVGPASMHCGTISGGSGLSTYAAEATAELERRTLPVESMTDVFAEIRDRVGVVDPDANVELLLERPPMVTDAAHPLADAVRAAIVEIAGSAARETGVAYWMDAGLFSAAGVPTVDYGPTGAGAHAAEEWVDIKSVMRCAEVLVRSVLRFMEAP